jgi:cell division protein FtsQ
VPTRRLDLRTLIPAGVWIGRFAVVLVLASALGLGLLFGLNWGESYLNSNGRFRFHMAQMAGETDNLRVMGANRTVTGEVRKIFYADHGSSLYRLPVSERREQIRQVRWVRDAVVIRRWPDGVDVMVEQRQPVAFAQLSGSGGAPKVLLVDDSGILLAIPDREHYELPLLLGLNENQSDVERAARVRLMRYFYKETAGLPVKIGELDVADTRNLKCRVVLDGRSVMLVLGGEGFRDNMQRLLDHWQEIQEKMPDVKVLDLRVADHITAGSVPGVAE